MDVARPTEIEPLSNRLAVHRLATAMLPGAIRLGVHPNSVTMAGLALGLLSALAYTGWRDWKLATLGFFLMVGWHVMDGLDGKLARATGKTTDFGRFLDGIADYSTFVAVGLALALTHDTPGPALALALTGGLLHAFQSQFYEGERATYIRRQNGRFQPVSRPEAGGLLERLYNRCEAFLGNRARPFDAQLEAADSAERERLLAAWRPRAQRAFVWMSPLSANSRTVAIWLAVLAGDPIYYWIWEILVLSVIALAAALRLRQAEA